MLLFRIKEFPPNMGKSIISIQSSSGISSLYGKNSIFLNKGKTVISVENLDFF